MLFVTSLTQPMSSFVVWPPATSEFPPLLAFVGDQPLSLGSRPTVAAWHAVSSASETMVAEGELFGAADACDAEPKFDLCSISTI
jgi:hypothetical protein